MSFREKRPGSLDTSDEAIARADARVRALPTKNTFIEFPVSVGQLEAVNSPAGGLRPYTTPAWMQTDLAASVRAAVSGDERDGSCCPRTPSPPPVKRSAPLFEPQFQTPAAPASQTASTYPYSNTAPNDGATPMAQSSYGSDWGAYEDDNSFGQTRNTSFAPQFVYSVPAFDTASTLGKPQPGDPGYEFVPASAQTAADQVAWS
jgi:hypothetical protein